MKSNKNISKKITYLALHGVLLLYSLCSVCSKVASAYPFLSWQWILWYGFSLLGLALYAILWQQCIKHMPLSTAFANKAVVIIWGLLWSAFIFKETISWNMLLGIAIIVVGIYIVGTCHE